MGLFFRNFEIPGPGVPENEPRKTGMRRFADVFILNGWNIFKAGFLAVPGFLLWYAGVMLSVRSHVVLFMVAAGIVGGMAAAPQLVGLVDTILRALRDEPGSWWLTYADAWKKNWKASLLPGAIAGFVHASLLFAVYHAEFIATSVSSLVLLVTGVLLTLGLSSYIWPQLALMNIGFAGILRNSVLLFMRHLLRSFGAAAVQLAAWAIFLFLEPLSLMILLVFGPWTALYPAIFMIYQPMEQAFDIEKRVNEFHQAQFTDEEE